MEILNSPTEVGSAEPSLVTGKNGEVFLSWTHQKNDTAYLKFSSLSGDQWSSPQIIGSGTNWFVNWADYPTIAVNDQNFAANFLVRNGQSAYAYDAVVSTSVDKGEHWTVSTPINDDRKEAEHGFVSIIPYKENFFVTWLDGRNTVMEGMENMEGHEGHHGSMSIRAAIIDKNNKKVSEWELDNKTCDCCQTSSAMTNAGPIVVYRDRSHQEIRDISIVRLIDGKWTVPKPVSQDNWKINGCPVNGPRVVASGDDVVVAWYTGAQDSTQVKISFSADGGATFGKAILINEKQAIGRVDIEMLSKELIMICWMEDEKIKAAKVHADGTKEATIIIASSSSARSSGFPQMTKSGDHLIFAWTDEASNNIKLMRIKI